MTKNQVIVTKQTSHHDKFFKSLYSKPEFALELFRLIFSKKELQAYNWKKLTSEKDTFPEGRRADLVFSVPLKNKPGTLISRS